MAIQQTLDTLYLCWLSRPKTERSLYRLVRRRQVRSIVELGLDSIDRCQRMLRIAKRSADDGSIHFTGIDQFEARSDDQPRLTLKQTHQRLSGSGASIRLIPGDTFSALAHCANQLQGTQLLLISPNQNQEQLESAWRYVPRMLAEDAVIMQGTPTETGIVYRSISQDDLRVKLGHRTSGRQAA